MTHQRLQKKQVSGNANVQNSNSKQNVGKKKRDSGKNDPHGDNGRAKTKAEKQIKDLEQKARESKSKKRKNENRE